MKSYLEIVEEVLLKGSTTPNRAKVQGQEITTRTIPGAMLRVDLQDGFPLLTTKKMPMKQIAGEADFFLKGEHRKEDLHRRGVTIWDEWKAPHQEDDNELGPIYGVQWRRWAGISARRAPKEGFQIDAVFEIDQIKALVKSLREKPFDRRQVVTAWNPAETHLMSLPACHMIWQTVVTKDREGGLVLNVCSTMRSADLMLGVPFNIASYALLTHLLAKTVGMKPGVLALTMNNCHIYENHVVKAVEQIDRRPSALPTLEIPDREDGQPFDLLDWDCKYKLTGYSPQPAIPMEVAV